MSETDRPELSVVISTLGIAPLERAVTSVIASFEEADVAGELVVAWQGSTPPPEFRPPVRLLEVFPFGLSYGRNRGFDASHASIVGFVDDDEVIHPQWARAVLAAFSRMPHAAGVFGTIEPLDSKGFGYCHVDGSGDRVFQGSRVWPWAVGTGGNMAFRREALLNARGFNLTFGPGAASRAADDTDLIIRLLRRGETLLWTSDMRVYHPTKSESERLASRYPYGFAGGRVLRRHRAALHAARYGRNLVQSFLRGDRRVRRETLATARGFIAGAVTRVDLTPPRHISKFAPEELCGELESVSLQPLRSDNYRPDPHFLYAFGPARVLHVYLNPGERLCRALEDRERIRRDSGVGGIPVSESLLEGRDALWLVESRLPGTPPSGRAPASWFGPAAEWLLRMAGTAGPPLETSSGWRSLRDDLTAVCPQTLRSPLEAALDALGPVPAAHVHGDLSRKNLLLTPSSVGAVDWETCSLHGLPGLDLVFLALTAKKGGAPDPAVLESLVQGSDPSFAPLHTLLARAGVGADLVRPALLVMLAKWAADERRRLSALGAFEMEPVYGRLLERFGPALIEGAPVVQ